MNAESPDRWARIDALFGEALDRPAEARLAFLEAACGQDRALFESVRMLLDNAAAAGRVIGESATGFAAELLESFPMDDEPQGDGGMIGRIVGPYRLTGELGRGGMGAVYRGERADGQFEKAVAIKLVKRGMDTDEILRRFQFERRILAGLEHPNIARLYDGGATNDGRPYLVMELVEGERITDYCDARGLALDQRLALFRSVCAGVQHAHQNLVVHRDIKPSNILVTDAGVPKLLDFGIAKLVDDAADEGPRTRTGVRVLTPEYAAPEQRRGEPVTTASDVFALGAVLYELLTGRRPFDQRPAAPGAPAEPGRGVLRPSAAVGRDPTGSASAAPRSTTPDRLRRALRGDLDTVILKALSEDPRLRYQSAQQLLDDIDRYRSGLPVTARPAALGYRAGKFARRHRVGLTAAALAVVSLIGGLGVALWQASRAAVERDRAEAQRLIAEDERDTADEVVAFLEGMFAASDPFSSRPGRLDTMRIGAILDLGADRADQEFKDRPMVRARMLSVIGRAYRSLGVYDRSEALLTQALADYRALHGDRHLDVANASNALGNLYLDLERPADAETLHRQALDTRRALLGPDNREVAQSLNNLAAALQNAGKLDDAESLYDELLGFHRRLDAPDSASYADVLNTRMMLAFRKDDVDAALPLAREILQINHALFGEAHPRVAQSMNNVAQLLTRTGADREAEPLLRQSLAINRTILGGEHPHIAAGADNLASVLQRLGMDEEAEPLYLEAIAMKRRLLGGDHPSLAVTLSNYADLLWTRGSLPEAERLYREALGINRAAFGPDHVSVGIVSTRLAAVLCNEGRVELGRELRRTGLATLRATLDEQHPHIAAALSRGASCGPDPDAEGLPLN